MDLPMVSELNGRVLVILRPLCAYGQCLLNVDRERRDFLGAVVIWSKKDEKQNTRLFLSLKHGISVRSFGQSLPLVLSCSDEP
jgi:hypothetical protein